jgi:hypothetical protein
MSSRCLRLDRHVALAQVPDECRANYGDVDLCAAARTIRDHVAPKLPARLAADMNLTMISATGRRVIMSATWGLTEAQFSEQLTIRHITAEQFAAHLERLTKRPGLFLETRSSVRHARRRDRISLRCKRRVRDRGAGHHNLSLRRGPRIDRIGIGLNSAPERFPGRRHRDGDARSCSRRVSPDGRGAASIAQVIDEEPPRALLRCGAVGSQKSRKPGYGFRRAPLSEGVVRRAAISTSKGSVFGQGQ